CRDRLTNTDRGRRPPVGRTGGLGHERTRRRQAKINPSGMSIRRRLDRHWRGGGRRLPLAKSDIGRRRKAMRSLGEAAIEEWTGETRLEARMRNPALVLPEAMKALQALDKAVSGCGVPARTLDLVHLRASQINGCSVRAEMHARELKWEG